MLPAVTNSSSLSPHRRVFWPQRTACLVFPIHATCHAHLILCLFFPILYGVVYQLRHSFSCSLLQALPSLSCSRMLYVYEIWWNVCHNWSLCSGPVQKLKSGWWISHLSTCFTWLSIKLMDWHWVNVWTVTVLFMYSWWLKHFRQQLFVFGRGHKFVCVMAWYLQVENHVFYVWVEFCVCDINWKIRAQNCKTYVNPFVKEEIFVEPYDMNFKCCNMAFGVVRLWLSNLLDLVLWSKKAVLLIQLVSITKTIQLKLC